MKGEPRNYLEAYGEHIKSGSFLSQFDLCNMDT